MAERLIPISKKQHDSFKNLADAIEANRATFTTMANTILQGIDDDLGQVVVVGPCCENGVYSLVLTLPDIAPSADAMSA